MLDIELEIEHVMYIFFSSLGWLLMSIWGKIQLGLLYTAIPTFLNTVLIVSIVIGSLGSVLAIVLFFTQVFD